MSSSQLSVVVADDDEQTAEVVGEMLAAGGFNTVVTHSAYEALGYLVEKKPSVIVSDVRMRGLDGLEFLQRAMAMRDPDLDVILMSGWSMLSDEQALALGSFGQLDKPFDGKILLSMVEAAAKNSKIAGTPTASCRLRTRGSTIASSRPSCSAKSRSANPECSFQSQRDRSHSKTKPCSSR